MTIDTQHAHFGGKPLSQAKTEQLNDKKINI